jgi:muramoyltetrapeptide carboxypeptidase
MKRTVFSLLSIFCFFISLQSSSALSQSTLRQQKHVAQWIKPQRLKVGDTVALVNSASRTAEVTKNIMLAKERLETLGLHVILGKSVYLQDGYFSGTDQARAADINEMFANSSVKAIFEMRGGWGCARVLPYLDYAMIRKNPKILIGFSDITALLLAIGKYSNLVSYYGPLAGLPWPDFTTDQLKKVLFDGIVPVTLKNPKNEIDVEKDIIQSKDRIQTLIPGTAKGVLIGGNLSIIVSLLGTPYEPDWTGKILFVEDVNETHYRIDRMMEQLQEAGVLKKVRGFIFGTCKNCRVDIDMANSTNASFSIDEILMHYIKPYNIPAFMGSMIGHYPKIFTVPEGINAEMDANTGTIRLLEPSVST